MRVREASAVRRLWRRGRGRRRRGRDGPSDAGTRVQCELHCALDGRRSYQLLHGCRRYSYSAVMRCWWSVWSVGFCFCFCYSYQFGRRAFCKGEREAAASGPRRLGAASVSARAGGPQYVYEPVVSAARTAREREEALDGDGRVRSRRGSRRV